MRSQQRSYVHQWAPTVSLTALPPLPQLFWDYLGLHPFHHKDQLTLKEIAAYHLQDIATNLDFTAIARSTKITEKDKVEVQDEDIGDVPDPKNQMQSEFQGGEGED